VVLPGGMAQTLRSFIIHHSEFTIQISPPPSNLGVLAFIPPPPTQQSSCVTQGLGHAPHRLEAGGLLTGAMVPRLRGHVLFRMIDPCSPAEDMLTQA
jgi:hypothetical protein